MSLKLTKESLIVVLEVHAPKSLTEAYRRTLAITGNGVLFTGITLGLGVSTWIFSPLKFQADMGLLLCFLFLILMEDLKRSFVSSTSPSPSPTYSPLTPLRCCRKARRPA